MRAPAQLKDPAALLECIYGQLDSDAWLGRVAEALSPLVDFGWGVGLSLIHDVDGPSLVDVVSVGSLSSMYEDLQLAGVSLPPHAYRAVYCPARSIARASQPRTLQPQEGDVLRDALASIGADDALWVIGEPCAGYRFQMAGPLSKAMTLSLRQREAIRLVKAHLQTALRLRLRVHDLTPCAVFAGHTIKYRAPQLSTEDADQLAHRARTIERACLRAHRGSDDTLVQWTDLVQGRFSLVVQSEGCQGRRYLVYENARDDASGSAFSPMEQRAVSLLAQGLSTKQVAYELDTGPSSVSEAVSRAMLKLGVCSKSDLLALVHALRDVAGAADAPNAPNLSAAERAVLRFLRLGYSNEAIASARRTSARTVANQVGSILRKTGAINRHQAASGHRATSVEPPRTTAS